MNREYDKRYKQWLASVKKRDNYRCRMPYCKNTKKLQVHHIQKWSDREDLRFDINNGITLCRYCHSKIWGQEEYYSYLFINILKKDRLYYNRKKYEQKRKNQDSGGDRH
ncbi:MAG: HNH endonuclease signature motif containing protein [Bacteroidales bacterium]